MSGSNSDGPGKSRRPLLSRGELLSTKEDKARAGGEKFHPYTIQEAHKMLAPQARQLFEDVRRLPQELSGPHVVFEATLHPNYLAGSYFPEELLDHSSLYVVGVRQAKAPLRTAKREREAESTKTLILAGTPSAVSDFSQRVASGPSVGSAADWEQLREFRELTLPRRERIVVRRPTLGAGEVITWETVLTQIGRSVRERARWTDEVFEKWKKLVRSLGGDIDDGFRRDLGMLTFVPILLHGEAIDELAEFNLLRAIRPMPSIRPFPEMLVRTLNVAPKESRAAAEGRVPDVHLAIFDGGVNASLAPFKPFVTAQDITNEPPETRSMRHGTLVTSAALYGPLSAAGGDRLPDPTARITHYRVLPLPQAVSKKLDAGTYWLLDRIVETIRKDQLGLVSLSLGPDECVEDGAEPSRWTAELDALVHEHGVTIVAAAGNNGEDDASLGLNRVQAPSDMVNGIGVGACTSPDVTGKLVRAPYSAIGPGREGQRIQPTGVAFGGCDGAPFIGIDVTGRLGATGGTSFAAPSVARSVAGLRGELDAARHRTDMDRAFLAHFARRRSRGHRAIELGHGQFPVTLASHLECAAHEATVLYEDEILRGEVKALRFPLPSGIAPSDEIEIEWTLTFVTEVDPRDACDYTRSGIEAVFRPHELMRTIYPEDRSGKAKVVHVSRDAAEIQRALARGWRVSEQPPAHSQWRAFRRESDLRLEGKWETIVRGRVALPFGELHRPRLDLAYLRREGGRLSSGDGIPPLPVAALVTLRAPHGVSVYDRVATQFAVLRPLVRLPVRVPVA